MEMADVKKHIMDKRPQRLYVFTGEEYAVRNVYVEQIAKAAGLPLREEGTFAAAWARMRAASVLSGGAVYVVRDDGDVLTDEKAWDVLDNGNFRKSIVVLVFSALDKRSKFLKRYKDAICEFGTLPEGTLVKYAQREADLSEENCKRLIGICGGSYAQMLSELDKIKRFRDEVGAKSDDAIFRRLVESGAIYVPPGDAVFAWADAVLSGKRTAFELAEECAEAGEAVLVMLTVLYNNFKSVLQAQEAETQDVAAETGLSEKQLWAVKKHVGKRKASDLLECLRAIQQTEEWIKTGRMEEGMAVGYVMSKVF